MNIYKLLSTKERIKILNYILYKKDRLTVNNTARELRLSKSLISQVFNILKKEKILKKNIVQNNLRTRSLKILLNLANFDTTILNKPFVKSAGIYGSIVKGLNSEDSDMDIWILTKQTKEEQLAKLSNQLRMKYPNIKIFYLTENKLQTLKKEDAVFYHSLVFGSIIVYGDDLDPI